MTISTVLVVSSNPWQTEPRALKNALMLRTAYPSAAFTFADLQYSETFQALPTSHSFCTHLPFILPPRKHLLLHVVLRVLSALSKYLSRDGTFQRSFGVDFRFLLFYGLAQQIAHYDLVYFHGIMFAPLCSDIKSKKRGRHSPPFVLFDIQEVYSDMGDSAAPVASSLHVRKAESQAFRFSDICVCTSPLMRNYFQKIHPSSLIVHTYNSMPLNSFASPLFDNSASSVDVVRLYWRNSYLALGHRGLQDIIAALGLIKVSGSPVKIHLYIQGRVRKVDLAAINSFATRCNAIDMFTMLPPYAPQDVLIEASKYDIGLCLEQDTCLNHRLTTSNKIFDYMAAGLAVIVSNMPALVEVVQRAGSGLSFLNSNPEDLSRQILSLSSDPHLLASCRSNSREFMRSEGSWDCQVRSVLKYLPSAS